MKLRFLAASLLVLSAATFAVAQPQDARLKHSYRKPAENGWTFVHLEGSPADIGFQHGYLLAKEIANLQQVEARLLAHDTGKDWTFFRDASRTVLWPHLDEEYRAEMQGIADGVKAQGGSLDVWDIVAMNASLEWSYYTDELKRAATGKIATVNAEHCSAFVATGSYTKDGKIVIAHNNWTDYLDGERWTVVFDIQPIHGYRFIMDGLPGYIDSADDFGINSAGMMITETTIGNFHGFDPNGVAEFDRARKAMQYSNSIDDFTRIMKNGNNGGYANTWLIGDRKTNEIARLELGLKVVTLERTKDGYFVGSNFDINPKMIAEETSYNVKDMSTSSNARHVRWDQLMAENKGQIDVAKAESFLGDHYDSYEKKIDPDERSLDGHIDLSPRGIKGWQKPYAPAGAVENKVSDSDMAKNLSFAAYAGHACGMDFKANAELKAHPEFDWQAPLLTDMNAGGWKVFAAK
jgi:hypothetical protein